MFLKKKSKYSCVFCSNIVQKSKKRVNFCSDCLKIRNWVREKGLQNLLQILEEKTPTAPAYAM